MFKATLAICVALFFAGIGNVMLSKGMRMVGPLETYQLVPVFHYFCAAVANPWVILGILMELAYFLAWLVVLSWADVSWAVPMNAVEYIFVAILAAILLGESVNFDRWVGVVLITAGAFFMMKSWKSDNGEDKENLNDPLT
ncbi:MAG: DMT family transporter [Deltaproteobacteria bacterium]|nr:DMT family transporter [Deltaproteobacteria bacterium]